MRKEGTSIPLSLSMDDLEAEAFYTIRKKIHNTHSLQKPGIKNSSLYSFVIA